MKDPERNKNPRKIYSRINTEDHVAIQSERFVPTPDDWSPSYNIEGSILVKGTVMIVNPMTRHLKSMLGRRHIPKTCTHYLVRVCFWGNDDSGIERDRYYRTLDEALAHYEKLTSWLSKLSIVCRYDLLKSAGFQPA